LIVGLVRREHTERLQFRPRAEIQPGVKPCHALGSYSLELHHLPSKPMLRMAEGGQYNVRLPFPGLLARDFTILFLALRRNSLRGVKY
jgi:hypothetical protein